MYTDLVVICDLHRVLRKTDIERKRPRACSLYMFFMGCKNRDLGAFPTWKLQKRWTDSIPHFSKKVCSASQYCTVTSLHGELLTAQSFNESLGVPRGFKSHRKRSATATPQSVFNLHRRILTKQENKRYDGGTYDDKMLVACC